MAGEWTERMDGARDESELAFRLRTRGELTAFLTALTHSIGAEYYMLVAVPVGRSGPDLRILASNWIYDTVNIAGHDLLARLVASPFATAPGARPQPLITAHAPDTGGALTAQEAQTLHTFNHSEIWVLRSQAGAWRFFALFSSPVLNVIEPEALQRAQIECGYALAQVPGLLAAAASENPLSERERECLYWVSQGKTTEEVSLILGVAANTVNSYITHAMQKLSACNRPMAVATAIRSGII